MAAGTIRHPMNAHQQPGTAIGSSAIVDGPGASELTEQMRAVATRIASQLAARCDASTDEQAIEGWLDVHAAASVQTRRAYEREARRLLAWLIWKEGPQEQLLPLVTLPQATAFVRWLAWPAGDLVPEDVLLRAGLKPRQPVKNGLLTASLTQAVVILSSLYGHLSKLRAPWGIYAPFNPFHELAGTVKRGLRPDDDETSSGKSERKPLIAASQADPVSKALSQGLWREVLASIELMPRDTPAQERVYWQTWWILRLHWHSVFRRFESVKALMSDVKLGAVGYQLRVTGKGNRADSILMSEPFVQDLRTYRLALGMPAMPTASETGPLIVHTSPGREAMGTHISEATLYRRVMGIFAATADRLDKQPVRDVDPQPLREATPHSLRHTGITHLLDAGVSMRTTSRLARHKSIATTAIYDSQDKCQQRAELNAGAKKSLEGSVSFPESAPASAAATVELDGRPE